jgi:hypothetical protein
MVDATDLKSVDRKVVWVQVPSPPSLNPSALSIGREPIFNGLLRQKSEAESGTKLYNKATLRLIPYFLTKIL